MSEFFGEFAKEMQAFEAALDNMRRDLDKVQKEIDEEEIRGFIKDIMEYGQYLRAQNIMKMRFMIKKMKEKQSER